MTTQLTRPRERQAVAQYVRMSTEHQQYSTENQCLAILEYAQARNMDIVRTYSDHGKSGLNITGRAGLKRLLDDVRSGDIDFSAVLVYDVSRWGRFQNPDQGASYEYALMAADIMVHYCAEQFQNDGSLSSTLLKTVKRGMAGEYSRELSVKVWAGQRRLIELGFRQGGQAGYGLRRRLIDQHREFKQELNHGDRKSLQTDRVILIPGPVEEVDIVHNIYKMFVTEGMSETRISDSLNGQKITWIGDRPWTRDIIREILTNHKYAGMNVFNRKSHKLKLKRVNNPPIEWIIKPEAFQPLVSSEEFAKAQVILASRSLHVSNEDILARLRNLLSAKGFLSGFLIDEASGIPSSRAVAARFGSLLRAYTLVGWTPGRDYRYLEINRQIRKQHTELVAKVCNLLIANGAKVERNHDNDLLTINEEYSVSLILSKCTQLASGGYRWFARFETALSPDITIAVRLSAHNDSVMDYYLIPRIANLGGMVRLTQSNPLSLEVYRFDNLDFFALTAQRLPIEAVA